jgi:hypothetical protein
MLQYGLEKVLGDRSRSGGIRRRVTFEATVIFTGSGASAMRRSAFGRPPL